MNRFYIEQVFYGYGPQTHPLPHHSTLFFRGPSYWDRLWSARPACAPPHLAPSLVSFHKPLSEQLSPTACKVPQDSSRTPSQEAYKGVAGAFQVPAKVGWGNSNNEHPLKYGNCMEKSHSRKPKIKTDFLLVPILNCSSAARLNQTCMHDLSVCDDLSARSFRILQAAYRSNRYTHWSPTTCCCGEYMVQSSVLLTWRSRSTGTLIQTDKLYLPQGPRGARMRPGVEQRSNSETCLSAYLPPSPPTACKVHSEYLYRSPILAKCSGKLKKKNPQCNLI